MLARNRRKTQPDVFQHLHEIVVFTIIALSFRDDFAVAIHRQRKFVMDLLFIARRVFRSRHRDDMQDGFIAIAFCFRKFRLEFNGFVWPDPRRPHARPIVNGNGIRQIIRLENDLPILRFRHKPIISRPRHNDMAAQIFRPDRELDPPFCQNVLCRELKYSRQRNEFENSVFRHIRLDSYSRQAAMRRAFPAGRIQQCLFRTMPWPEPNDGIIQLKDLCYDAIGAFQMSIPMIIRMIVTS